MTKGITRRWIVNTLGVILVVVVLLVVFLSVILQNYYYNGIEQTLSGRADELVNVLSAGSTSDFETTARSYVEKFPDKQYMELMVIDSAGKIIITSTGFQPDQNIVMNDYNLAKQNGK